MNNKKVKRGDFVIVNDVDRPCPELVAVVVAAENGLVDCQYLSAKVNHGQIMVFPDYEPTNVHDFGKNVFVSQYTFMVVDACGRYAASAYYKNGNPRAWQNADPRECTQPLKEKFWNSEFYNPPVAYSKEEFDQLLIEARYADKENHERSGRQDD